jgi:predicted anti-sigma-YlaC factor YlaD
MRMRPDCACEPDLLDAVASGRWPDRAEQTLREHVAHCATCADVADVAAAFADERDVAWAEARTIPPANVVWMRAQARARADAARQAARPIAVMQALGFACAAGVMSTLIGTIAWWLWARIDWLALPTLSPASMDVMALAVRGVLLAIGLWLVLAPVAVYLTADDDIW